MGDTSIEWTDKTWNPVRGCSKVSAGCMECYAMHFAARFSDPGQPYEGLATRAPARWTGKVRLVPEHMGDPLKWKKPRRVFVNSMSDLFHEGLTNEEIDRVFAVMALCDGTRTTKRHHTFQILTKRSERMARYFSDPDTQYRVASEITATVIPGYRPRKGECDWRPMSQWPLPNVWLGVSVEDQKTADERIPPLLRTPAAVRFVSYEPALEPVDFGPWLGRTHCRSCQHVPPGDPDCGSHDPSLHWLIVGGESGPGARPFDVAWARSVVAQCKAADVPCFVKQLGSRPVGYDLNCDRCTEGCDFGSHGLDCSRSSLGSKGENFKEFPEELRVREFPEVL